MRLLFTFLFLIGIAANVVGQNLVVNGSFEDFTSCELNGEFMDSVIGWSDLFQAPSSCDLFTTCSTHNWYTVPENLYGNLNPLDGESYGGFIAEDGRESPMGSLTNGLHVDSTYFVSFGLSLCERCEIASAQIGITFWDSLIQLPLGSYSDVIHSYEIPGYPAEKNSWQLVEFFYTASSTFNYFSIGFYGVIDSTTLLSGLSGDVETSYYHIDNVIVRPATQSEINGMHYDSIEFGLFPNPATDVVRLESKKQLDRVAVRDVLGNLLLEQEIQHTNQDIDVRSLAEGVYLIEVHSANGGRGTQRLVIQR
jgi:hypothetical protein